MSCTAFPLTLAVPLAHGVPARRAKAIDIDTTEEEEEDEHILFEGRAVSESKEELDNGVEPPASLTMQKSATKPV